MHKKGIFYGESNENYHSDNGYRSSSQLKDAINDIVMYYQKYILKTIKKEEKECYAVGNAYHCKILEPKKFKDEFVKMEGIKRGEKWKVFEAKHKGKTILGNKSWLEYELLVESTLANKDAVRLLKGSQNEVSIYTEIEGFPIKVRFDILNIEKGYGADPKSTTGLLIGRKGTYVCRKKIAGLDYDLSAALYMDAVNKVLTMIHAKSGKKGLPKLIKTWYWIFASKDFKSCKVLEASPAMLENGREKYKLAIAEIKKQEAANWKTKDLEEGIEIIDPLPNDIVGQECEIEGWD